MNESDFEWLQQFARAGDQAAFRGLVQRHIDLVFATALRKAGDAGAAEEISQNVFGVLARKAWQFAPDDSLPAWLYKTTLLESKSWLRGELRRRVREQTAAELGTTMKTPDDQPAFNALVPLLDDALLSLREKDRTALLLRYYEKQSLREVGGRLGVSEDTAQKRVQTALENLSQFFQQRGFKTATSAAAAVVLQQTTASASAVTTLAITGAVLKTAPPAVTGITALLSRLIALSKAQTATVCLLVAAGPVLWQWNQMHQAHAALAQMKANEITTQNELLDLQTETDSLLAQSTNLDNALAEGARVTDDHADLERRFAGWKQRTRARLLGPDYQWPDDLTFIRVPKKILPQLSLHQQLDSSGRLIQPASELLGLSPEEHQQMDSTLGSYFSSMSSLLDASRFETNQPHMTQIPGDSLVSQVFEMPALGSAASQFASQLDASLQDTLGDQRWQSVSNTMAMNGTPSLRESLDLDAADHAQEVSVWVREVNGQYFVGSGWASSVSAVSSTGVPLKYFLPGAQLPSSYENASELLDFGRLPGPVSGPALAWIQQQAASRLANQGGQ